MPRVSKLTGSFQPLPTGNFFKWSWHLKDYPYCVVKTRNPSSLSEVRLTPDINN